MSSCQIFLAAIKSHFSANKLLLNILIGVLLEELNIILQVLSSILKGQTCIVHILLLKSEQRMSQKVAEPRPNFQKDFPDKKWLLVLSKCLWFPIAKFLSTLHNLRSLDTCLVLHPSCLKYVHVNFPNTVTSLVSGNVLLPPSPLQFWFTNVNLYQRYPGHLLKSQTQIPNALILAV